MKDITKSKHDTIAKNKSKKHIMEARIGIQGEAFFEYLMSDKAIVHKIATNKDTGIDFLCHWLNNDSPSKYMFGVQVKTRSKKPIDLKRKSDLNGLYEFSINVVDNSINENDIDFWKLFTIPIYLFVLTHSGNDINGCYYKRLTPSLTRPEGTLFEDIKNKIKSEPYYKIDSNDLCEASNIDSGFYRDLSIDRTRCLYNMGAIYSPDGGTHKIYLDIVNDYVEQIQDTEDSISAIISIWEKDAKLKRLYPNIGKLQ